MQHHDGDRPGLVYRAWSDSDIARVVDFWASIGEAPHLGDDPRSLGLLRTRNSTTLLLVEEERTYRIAGTVLGAFDGRRGWIYRLVVDPGMRRRGIARKLMRRVEEELAAVGCPKVNLMVAADNAPALKLYRSMGYGPSQWVEWEKRLPGTTTGKGVADEAADKPRP